MCSAPRPLIGQINIIASCYNNSDMSTAESTSMAWSTALTTTLQPMATSTATTNPGFPLVEPTSSFPLWSITLITLSALVVISMVFVMTVLLCRIAKDRTNKHHTYHTRSRQGSIRLQGSVSLIKNQESLEVTNAHYRSQRTTAMIPEDNSESSRSVELNEEEQVQAVPCDESGEQELRRIRSRSNNESLQEITEREELGGGMHMYNTPFENTRTSQQHQSSNSQLENTCSHSIGGNLQNNQSESVSTVTRESQQTTETAAVNQNAVVTVSLTFEDGSNLHDIPGFQDPELKGEDEDEGRLRVNAPPNIYSSQILSIAVNDQDEGGYGYQEEREEYGTETMPSMGMDNESEIPSSQDMHIILNTDSQLLQDFDTQSLPQSNNDSPNDQSRESQIGADNHRLTPEGAQDGNHQEYISGSTSSTILLQHDLHTTDEDVVYDRPVIKHRRSPSAGNATGGDDEVKLGDVDPSTLFDNPGYSKGMMQAGKNGGNSSDSGAKQSQLQLQLSTQEHTPSSADFLASPFGLPLQHLGSSNASKMQTLSVQMGRVPGIKSSIDSLALLDYDDSELNELDPVIASCLKSPNLSDTDDEIAISEV